MGAAVAAAVTTMTDRSGGLPVATIAAALFCVVLIYLALQVRAGQDPAIGAGKPAGSPPGQVVVRRIVVRRIVEQPTAATSAGGVAPAASAPTASSTVAAPVAVAPAPAPAPVVSGGS
jgi:hypothetical protein